jgi:hypothetical protein
MGSVFRGMALGCGGVIGIFGGLVIVGMIISAMGGSGWNPGTPASPSPAAKSGPATPTPIPESLPHGTDITPPRGGAGNGLLTLKNGNERDAVVKLVEDTPQKTAIRYVYVRAKQDLVLRGIPKGSYQVIFMTGVDWDRANLTFRRDARAMKIGDTFLFEEKVTGRSTEYTTWELTLNRVPGGTIVIESIPADEFRK